MFFTSNIKEFELQTSLPESFDLKAFLYEIRPQVPPLLESSKASEIL
jgi:hypothetical protein